MKKSEWREARLILEDKGILEMQKYILSILEKNSQQSTQRMSLWTRLKKWFGTITT